MKKNNH